MRATAAGLMLSDSGVKPTMSAKSTLTSRSSGTPRAALCDSEVAMMRAVTWGERKRPSRSRFFSSATIRWLRRARSTATAA